MARKKIDKFLTRYYSSIILSLSGGMVVIYIYNYPLFKYISLVKFLGTFLSLLGGYIVAHAEEYELFTNIYTNPIYTLIFGLYVLTTGAVGLFGALSKMILTLWIVICVWNLRITRLVYLYSLLDCSVFRF